MLKAFNESSAAKTFATNNHSSLSPNVIVEYAASVTGISLNPTCKTVGVGWSGDIIATVYPSSAQNKKIQWTSSNSNVASVDKNSGRISAKQTGSTVITATTVDGGYTARCTLKVCEIFNYTSSTYNADLALKCAEYAMLAYEGMILTSEGYKDVDDKGSSSPTELNKRLQQDHFENISQYNYRDNDPHNVSYTLANKQVLYNGVPRTLVAVVIRGTDKVEWQGNMDVTGVSYNASMNDHYSFKQAEIDLRTNSENGLTNYLVENNITNPIYLITGHSRGAAVANLLAETLSTSAGVPNVFAYTFATPNNTKTPNTLRKNIYNFCFNDDFVPQVPLTSWGYGKHGITFTKTANDLYEGNPSFKKDMERYVKDSRGKDTVSFNLTGTNSLLHYVEINWKSVQEYYEETHMSCMNTKETLYTFFRGTVAPAAMKNPYAITNLVSESLGLITTKYTTIADFFVSGSGSAIFADSIYNAHCAFTYYTAMKYGLFV